MYCREYLYSYEIRIDRLSERFITSLLVRESRDRREILNGEKREVREIEFAREKMQTLWYQMQNCGVELFVDGKEVSPVEAATRTVRENSPYMADYVLGENGILSQLRFDRVTHR
jgi:hypothetical protein